MYPHVKPFWQQTLPFIEGINVGFRIIRSLFPRNNHMYKLYFYPILQMKKLRQRELIRCPRPHHFLKSLKPTARDVLKSFSALVILLWVAPSTTGTSNNSAGGSQLLSAKRPCLRQGQTGSRSSSHPWRGCTSRTSQDALVLAHQLWPYFSLQKAPTFLPLNQPGIVAEKRHLVASCRTLVFISPRKL